MKPRSLMFTIFGEYMRHFDNEIWIGSLTRLLGSFGMSEQAIRVAVSRMQKQGWLTSEKRGNKSFYSLTVKSRKRLEEAARRIYRSNTNQWDGRWHFVQFSIPEEEREKRDQLRKELQYLGFGMLTASLWLSPNSVFEYVHDVVEELELKSYVELFYAQHVGYSAPRLLVERCWNLDEITKSYEQFIDMLHPIEKRLHQHLSGKNLLNGEEAFILNTTLVHEYRKFLFIDPDLPRELLPENWIGEEADARFDYLYHFLQPLAMDYFSTIYENKMTVEK